MKPLVFDLYAGLGGWSEAFLAEGYRAVGFDIEKHDYGKGGYPGQLVIRDARSLSGAEMVKEFGVPACIVASPPCQEFSYMAMPWTKAKEKMRKIQADPAEQVRLTDLFNQCFRIQREVSEAAGHYVPMVVENVRGAQRWVGKARWNFGSFYLWGDVPALMPITTARRRKKPMVGTGNQLCAIRTDQIPDEGFKTRGLDWNDQSMRGQAFTSVGGKQNHIKNGGGSWFAVAHNTTSGKGQNPDGRKITDHLNRRNGHAHTRHLTNPAEHLQVDSEGVKGFTPNGEPLGKNALGRKFGSKSKARKAASAQIAKIPAPLASWIARVFKPKPTFSQSS